MLKLCHNTGIANSQITVTVFFAFSSNLCVVLTLLVYSFFSRTFISLCCKPSLPSVPRYKLQMSLMTLAEYWRKQLESCINGGGS